MGLIDTLSLFGAVVLAIPIALLGVEFLLGGRTLVGAAFLALGVGFLAGQHFLPDLKGEAVDTAAGVVLGDAAESRGDDAGAKSDANRTDADDPRGE